MTDRLPPTVVEIRCPKCSNGFSIRTNTDKKQKLCYKCLRAYIVRLYLNGVVTVKFIETMGFIEQDLPREHYSVVTDGE